MLKTMFLLLVLGASPPNDEIIYDDVDRITWNTFYNDQGTLVFHQALFENWNPKALNQYTVVDFKLFSPILVDLTPKERKARKEDNQGFPISASYQAVMSIEKRGDFYFATFIDRNDNTIHVVRAPLYKRWHTQFDPELEQRQFLEINLRPKLTTPAKILERKQLQLSRKSLNAKSR